MAGTRVGYGGTEKPEQVGEAWDMRRREQVAGGRRLAKRMRQQEEQVSRERGMLISHWPRSPSWAFGPALAERSRLETEVWAWSAKCGVYKVWGLQSQEAG